MSFICRGNSTKLTPLERKISHITVTMVEQILFIVSQCSDKDRISSFIIGIFFAHSIFVELEERHQFILCLSPHLPRMKNNACLKSLYCTFIVIVIFEYLLGITCMVSSLLSSNVLRIKVTDVQNSAPDKVLEFVCLS